MIIYTICMYMYVYVYKLEYSIVYRRTRERERSIVYATPLVGLSTKSDGGGFQPRHDQSSEVGR